MTVSTRLNAPSHSIFNPDALDQIYAKGELDPIMGGIAGALGNAHRMAAQGNRAQYMQSQDKFNKMAAVLDAMDIDAKSKQEAMKIAGALVGKGEDPTLFPSMSNVYGDSSAALLPGMLRNKLAADTAAAGRSGSDSGTKYTRKIKTLDLDGNETMEESVSSRQPLPPHTPAGPSTKPGSTPNASKANTNEAKARAIVATATKTIPDAVFTESGGKVIATSKSNPSKRMVFNSDGVVDRQQ